MHVPVHMLAFNEKGTVRNVFIADEYTQGASKDNILALTFQYGQNDFQPKPVSSVSVGDVIELDDEYWLVAPIGFKQITKEQFDEIPGNLTQHHDLYWSLCYGKGNKDV